MAESMHVKIEDSITTRKTLLKIAIDAAKLIKSNEEIKTIKEKKLNEINKFNAKIKSIKLLVNKVKTELPELEGEKKPIIEEKPARKPIMRKESTELDALSDEIKHMEEKLRKL